MTDPRDVLSTLRVATDSDDELGWIAVRTLAAVLDERDENERLFVAFRARCWAAEDARDAALARVAALEDALREILHETDGWTSRGWPLERLHSIKATARAALAPLEPRTLETDLREDR